jgi:hypothetical protein
VDAFGLAHRGVYDDTSADPGRVDTWADGLDHAAGVAARDAGVREIETGHAATDPKVHLIERAGERFDEHVAGGGSGWLGPIGAELDVGGDG